MKRASQMEAVTQWEVVTVIVVLVGLIGTILSGMNKFTEPIQVLKETTLKLTIAVDSLNSAIKRIENDSEKQMDHIYQNFKEIDERLEKYRNLIQQIFRHLELEEEHFVDN